MHGIVVKIVAVTVVVLLIALASAATLGCGPDSDKEDGTSIVGSWTWYERTGGIGGLYETPESTGKTRKVVFDDDGKVTFYEDGEVTISSTYSLAIEKTIFDEDPIPVINVDGVAYSYAYSFPAKNELVLKDDVYDGFIDKYTRDQ